MRLVRDHAGFLAAILASSALYALTLAPTVGAGDSGELILAARDFGIAHPPGYALWLLLARLFVAIPVGEIALRVNALSAAVAAIGAGLFWLLARQSGLRAPAAAVATALFATATVIWNAAVEAEVYALATAIFLLLALLAGRARRMRATWRDESLFFFVAGLSTVAHQTLVFPALALAVWVLTRPRQNRVGFARIASAIAWAVVGCSVTLVIPIRWSAGPAFAWTDVRGLSGLADYMLRRTYGGLAQNPFRLDRAVDGFAGMGGIVLASLGWVGSALALSGFVSGRARRVTGPLLLAALAIPAALVALLRFTPDAEHLAQVAPFLTPLVAVGALFAGQGAAFLARKTPPSWRHRAAVAVAILGCAAIPWRYVECNRSGFRLAERYANDLLAQAPPNATLVLDGDNETFLTAYATRVHGIRPDVTLRHRRGWIFGDPYGLRERPRAEWTAIAHRMELGRIRSGADPICYAIPPADLLASGVPFAQRGLLYQAGVSGSSFRLPPQWPRSSDLLRGHPERYDYVTRKMAVSYSDAAARWLWSHGRVHDAMRWFFDAARVGYDFPGAHLNAATAAAAAGKPELALEELLTACRLAPYAAEPQARLAVFLAVSERPRDAAIWFERAFRAEPSRALAADACRAWTKAGDTERAEQWGRRAAEWDGTDAAPAAANVSGVPG
ncbi:MAG TPA: DUF2723 domain-containing protein [Candidatus Eisenbacteria bacterium]|nr:DUF2723 domain-containing protein [Candidatus Eisenbacteria bacterium]